MPTTKNPQTQQSEPFALGIRVIIVLLVSLSAYQMFFASDTSVKKNTLAPSLTLLQASDSSQKILKFKGHYTILHFWATWCPTCVQTLPHSSARALKFKKKGIKYIMICMTQGLRMSALRNFLTEHRIPKKYWSFHHLDKGRNASSRYAVRVLPSFVVIDRQGKVASYVKGYASDRRLQLILQKLNKTSHLGKN